MSETITRYRTIKGLIDPSDPPIPRVGKIRLGEMQESQSGGKPHPAALDHFRFEDAALQSYPIIAKLYADPKTGSVEPKALLVHLHSDRIEDVFPYSYRYYGSTLGLKCEGDGETARRRVCPKCKEMTCAHKLEPDRVAVKCPCELLSTGKCTPVGTLRVIIPQITVEGVWWITTRGWNSIRNILGGLNLVRAIFGKIAGIPLTVRIGQQTVYPGGQAKKIYTLTIGHSGDAERAKQLLPGGPRFGPPEQPVLPAEPRVVPELPAPEDDDYPDEPPDPAEPPGEGGHGVVPPSGTKPGEQSDDADPLLAAQHQRIADGFRSMRYTIRQVKDILKRYGVVEIEKLTGDQAAELIREAGPSWELARKKAEIRAWAEALGKTGDVRQFAALCEQVGATILNWMDADAEKIARLHAAIALAQGAGHAE